MARLLSPDTACFQMGVKSAQTGTETVYRQRKGVFEVSDPRHEKALRAMGATDATVRASGRGYRCDACGFLALFPRHCGRCGTVELHEET